jgi:hypothetical protein
MSKLDQLFSPKELAEIDKKHHAALQKHAHRHYRTSEVRKIVKAGNPHVRRKLRAKLRAVYNRLKRRRRKKK